MRPSSFLVLAVLFVLGTLAVQAASFGGQEVDKGHILVRGPFRDQHPGKQFGPIRTQHQHNFHSKPGTCPRTLIRCAMLNPPNACNVDSECRGSRKCCEGSCGRACLKPQ